MRRKRLVPQTLLSHHSPLVQVHPFICTILRPASLQSDNMAQQLSPLDYANLPVAAPPVGVLPNLNNPSTRAIEIYVGFCSLATIREAGNHTYVGLG